MTCASGQGTAGEGRPLFRIVAGMEAARMLDALLSRQEAVVDLRLSALNLAQYPPARLIELARLQEACAMRPSGTLMSAFFVRCTLA